MFGRNYSKKTVAGFAVELVAVFVGVYLAFLFSDYQEELEDRAVRVKYYDTLILESRDSPSILRKSTRRFGNTWRLLPRSSRAASRSWPAAICHTSIVAA